MSAISLWPKRYYRFIHGLVIIDKHCKEEGLNRKDEISRFAAAVGEPEMADRLEGFMQSLDISGQTIQSWDFDMSEYAASEQLSLENWDNKKQQLAAMIKANAQAEKYSRIAEGMYREM